MKRKIYAIALLLFVSVAVLGSAPQAFACGGGGGDMSDAKDGGDNL